ncbi:uncharacterized protein CANTADRAFT_23433 [Suhomyces tanzawaensis NRRL Y-17324]|uniref:Zn(2)-C6 fungal-type domain-containing protein n=1 Tax=Suhomyces tanzawaensis NRRL Y-17324 TaxID=984487 RepID=A0A1E4SCT3_9ASCO|nr:uncharacterized protein CANTADRAFT_23433 [Suhomyces tanzawaensis NRRL Y-17324]ODV77303.1 hypothetical protein CANTADRAFT_23433 [Suhomyces tanzawaensis NRRL Y-17324]
MDPLHHNTVKRQRSSRACSVCRARKIRCDSDKKFPCTNCVTFNCECTFPEPKRPKKTVSQPPLSITTILPPTIPPPGQYPGYVEPPYPYPPPAQTNSPGAQQYRYYPQMAHPVQAVQPVQAPGAPGIPGTPHQAILPPPQPPQPPQGPQGPQPPQQLVALPPNLNERNNDSRFTISFSYNHVVHGQPFNYVPPNVVSSGIHPQVPDDTEAYIPQNPIKNISSRDLTPIFDIERNTFQSNTEHGIKICLDRKLSEYFYFGESSCYTFLQDDNEQNTNWPVPEEENTQYKQPLRKPNNIPTQEVLCELAVLKIKRAFELPSKFICSLLIKSFFDNVYAQVPIIDKESFLRHFNDPNPKKHPPIMLLQAVLLVGSRTCRHPAILDENGGISTVSEALYLRTRAFCDTTLKFEYVGDLALEDDGHVIFNHPTVLVQTLALLSWYWDAPEDVSRGSYFVVKNAINVAQSYGFHRDMERSVVVNSLLKRYQKSKQVTAHKIRQQCFYWKKIWWWLFTRDRSLSISFGRPLAIDMKSCEIKMLTEEDYELYESEWSIKNKKDVIVRDFYLALIKISEITGIIINEHYVLHDTTPSKRKYNVVKQLNFLMRHFLQELPESLQFSINNPESWNIYSYLIGSLYYVGIYHINRVMLVAVNSTLSTNIYWGICFQSACIFSTIAQHFLNRTTETEKLAAPFQMLYTTSMFMVFLSYHTQSLNTIVAKTSTKQMDYCIEFLEHCNYLWPSMTYLLSSFFEEYNKDGESQFPIRAKQLIFKICVQYQSDITQLKNKAPDINFLLNQQGSKPEGSKFRLNELDFTDTHLPLYKVRTMSVPLLGTLPDFFKDFTAVQLFPLSRDKKDKTDDIHVPETLVEAPTIPTPPTLDSVDGNAYELPGVFERDDGTMAISEDLNGTHAALMTPSDVNLMFDNEYFLTALSGIDWYNIG